MARAGLGATRMCLAIPGRIRSVSVDPTGARTALIEYPGTTRTASLLFLPDAGEGDYVLVQAGFAMRRLTAEQAEGSLRALEEGAAAEGAAANEAAGRGDVRA
jgi:hydrogenase expression/formation protein HypC